MAKAEKTVVISVRVERVVRDKLRRAAAKEKRSLSNYLATRVSELERDR